MIQLLNILLITFLQISAGFGLLHLLKINLKLAMHLSLSALLGIAMFSIIPFLLQLAFIPLTEINIFFSLIVGTIALNVRSKKSWVAFFSRLRNTRISLRLYEIPFLLLIALFVFVSAWRCYYYPPTPRDLTSGAEVIAEYAVKEKTMINSVFTVDLSTTNNQFKPAFITCLQIIYKYAGFPFGQIWLITVFICFVIFLYHVLTIKLHKSIAGLLLVMFIAIPEMYAYTIMALFDYTNSVFFFLSFYFLFEYFNQRQNNYLVFSGVLIAIATYIRSETLVLAFFAFTYVFVNYKQKSFLRATLKSAAYFLLPSLLVYILSITIYIKFYLPANYDADTLLNKNLLNIYTFFNRISEMTSELLLSGNSVNYYAYFVFGFVIVLVTEAFFGKGWNRNALSWLFAVFVVYFGLPFLGYLFPLYDLDNSTKRGLFKIFPLMLLFMANSTVLNELSNRIKKWEENH